MRFRFPLGINPAKCYSKKAGAKTASRFNVAVPLMNLSLISYSSADPVYLLDNQTTLSLNLHQGKAMLPHAFS